MDQMNSEEFILKFLQKERNKGVSLRQALNEDIGNKRIMLINQKRQFFLHITTLALVLSGGLTFFNEKVTNETYFYTSLVSFALTIIFVLLWMREIMDRDSKDLVKWQDKYNIAIEEKINLVDKHAKKNFGNISAENFLKSYFIEIKKLPSLPALIEDVNNLSGARKNRGKEMSDYSGECVVFLFLLGILFLVLSLINFEVNSYFALSMVLLLFSLSFQDIFLKFVGRISKLISIINKEIR